MALTDVRVRNAKPQDKPYKLSDGDGLFLVVIPSGSKYWRFKYYFAGKERLLALGVYPEIGLGDARDKRNDARQLLANGTDPNEARREAKRVLIEQHNNDFEAVAREWYEQRQHGWVPGYSSKMLARLENYVLPKLGTRPISNITAVEVLEVLRPIEKRGTLETAQIVKQMCGQIFMYAIATGRAERNPVPDLRGALKTPIEKHHACLAAADLPDFLNCLASYRGKITTRLAIELLMLTFVRTSELRAARWSEIDWDKAEWRIPAGRMKMREQHLVPLSTQALAVLRELQKHSGNFPQIFPNPRRPMDCMSDNAILQALHRMGYKHKATGHGFRATASTILNENGFPPDVIERQLAHCERNKVRAAYNHAQYLTERRTMMQWWADYLDKAATSRR